MKFPPKELDALFPPRSFTGRGEGKGGTGREISTLNNGEYTIRQSPAGTVSAREYR